MTKSALLSILLGSSAVVSGHSVHAQEIFLDDVLVRDDLLCVGLECKGWELPIPGKTGLKTKGINTAIRLEDTSSGSSYAATDWDIVANEPGTNGRDGFFISNTTDGTTPFTLLGTAGPSAIFVGGAGDVGFGTSTPQAELHVRAGNAPALRLDQDSSNGFTPQIWEIVGNEVEMSFSDVSHARRPFMVQTGTPHASLFVGESGSVGLGTDSPEGKFHSRGDGVQLAYLESSDGGPVQMRFRTDSENRRFLAVDNDNNVKSQIIFADDEIKFTGETDSGANLWLTIGPGGIISQGPTCSPNPCDRTFDTDFFTVSSIEERAEFMWENMYLPAVGPTKPHEPFNLTEKTAGILHELEVAHIYIAEQNEVIKSLNAELQIVNTRLDALETR